MESVRSADVVVTTMKLTVLKRESAKQTIASLPKTPEFADFRLICEESNHTFSISFLPSSSSWKYSPPFTHGLI